MQANNLNGHHYQGSNHQNKHQIRYQNPKKRGYDQYEDEDPFSGMINYENMGYDEDFEDDDEEKYSDKKQLVALLLAAFLGGFGAGR